MKEKDIIRLFDHIQPDTLAKADLDSGDLADMESAGEGTLARIQPNEGRPVGKKRFPYRPIIGVAAALAIVIASVFTATAPKPALGLSSPDYPRAFPTMIMTAKGQNART